MKKTLHSISQRLPIRLLLVAIVFGLASMLTLVFKIQLSLPGTGALTDPREILNSIGAAITGPVGGVIIGILSSLFSSPQIRWFSILTHVLSAVWIGWAYKKLIYEKYQMPYLVIGWIALMFVYFVVIKIAGLFFLKLIFPSLYTWLVGGNISFLNSLVRLFSGWYPEIIFTTVYSSLVLIALPKNFRKPLWGKLIIQPANKYGVDKLPTFLNKIFRKNFVAVRLSLWFLLLFAIPMIYLSILTGNYFMKYTLKREAIDQFSAAEHIAKLLDKSDELNYPDIITKVNALDERTIIIVDKDFNFLSELNEVKSSVWKEDYKNLVPDSIKSKDSGKVLNVVNGMALGYAKIKSKNLYVLSYSPKGKYAFEQKNFFLYIQLNFGIALLLVSALSGWIIWIIIGDPLKKLTGVAQEIGKQNYNVEINAQEMIDEVGLLATSIDQMQTAIKQTQLELFSNEAKFSSLISSMQDLVYTLDKDLKITGLYGQWSEMYGLTEELLIGKKLTTFLSPAESEINDVACNKSLKGEAVKFEWHLNKNGDKFYFESSLTPIFNKNDEITGILGVAREITDRVLNQKRLKESEDRYRILTEYSPDAIVVHLFGKIIYANLSAIQEVGARDKSELIDKDIFDFIHPDYKTFIAQRVKRAYEENEALPITEIKIIRIDNSVIDVEVGGVPIIYDGKRALQTIIRNITSRKKSETELKKLSSAVSHSPAGIMITDRHGLIEYVNPKFTEITQYTLNEVKGKNPKILKSGLQDAKFYDHFWGTLMNGGEWQGEIQNKRKSGEIYWERDLISSIKDSSGQITHFIAVKEDIEERKKIEQELILAKNRAEEADKLKSSLLSNMSHEFRTPLNGILGFTQLLKEEMTNPEHVTMLEKIMKSGRRLLDTLNSVLTLTELENRKYVIIPTDLDLQILCSQVKRQFELFAEEKGLRFEFEFPINNILVKTDENLLTRVIACCVDNAIKYTFEGGIKIKISFDNNSNQATIEIIDTGIGIDKSNQEIIFQEFRQLSEGYRRDYEGLGLGLSIAYKMIKLLQGDILVKSEYGRGSVFSIVIPIDYQSNLSKPTNDFTSPPQKQKNLKKSILDRKLKILLVEDNLLNIEVIQRFLLGKCTVESATEGEKALQIATNSLFDLLLIDINLGRGIDGIEVLRRIRFLPKYNGVPAIALTGYASASNMNEFLSQGFDGYIAKPFDKKSLVEEINRIFS